MHSPPLLAAILLIVSHRDQDMERGGETSTLCRKAMVLVCFEGEAINFLENILVVHLKGH